MERRIKQISVLAWSDPLQALPRSPAADAARAAAGSAASCFRFSQSSPLYVTAELLGPAGQAERARTRIGPDRPTQTVRPRVAIQNTQLSGRSYLWLSPIVMDMDRTNQAGFVPGGRVRGLPRRGESQVFEYK